MRIMLCGGTPLISGASKNAQERPFQTLPFDRIFLSSCNIKNPHILIIPTAMEEIDCRDMCKNGIETHYSKWLQCSVKVLYLASHYDPKEATRMLLWADCIYITGGNPEFLLQVWKETGFGDLIMDCIHRGKPVMGISAGAMILFDKVFSEVAGQTELSSIGLGVIDGACFPHFNREKNKSLRDKCIASFNDTPLLALDDGVCVEFFDKQQNVYSLSGAYNAYQITNRKVDVLNKTVIS